MTSIALVENHSSLRYSLKQLISSKKEFFVSHEAASSNDLMETILLNKSVPDIVIVDSQMQQSDRKLTAEFLQKKYPGTGMIILSVWYNELMGNPRHATASVHHAEYEIISQAISEAMVNRAGNNGTAKPAQTFAPIHIALNMACMLTQKQKMFLRFSATDLTYKEIAEEMRITPKTVDRYRDELFKKLNVKSRVGLALYASRIGLIG